MNIGDVIQAAIWIDGTETQEMRQAFERDVTAVVAEGQADHGVVVGPVIWSEKRPGDERVPPVPNHIQGPDVRLLVAEAEVIGLAPPGVGSFVVNELEPDDLERLRRITRRAYETMMTAHGHRGVDRLSDRQCDTIINDLGPEAAMHALRNNTADVKRVLH